MYKAAVTVIKKAESKNYCNLVKAKKGTHSAQITITRRLLEVKYQVWKEIDFI